MDDNLLKELISSLLEERKSERKHKALFRIFWSAIFVIFIVIILFVPFDETVTSENHTAIIEIDGIIAPSSEVSNKNIIPFVKKAMNNNSCLGIILKINSPGGSAVQSKLIHDEIIKLRSKTQKPIYSVIEDMGTSGGYYIAASTELIFSSSSSIVGSVGVRLDSFNFKALINRLGIEAQTISSGEDKTILDPFSKLSQKHRNHLKVLLLEIHNQFIDDVRKSRGEKLKGNNIFSGLFWTGTQAKEIGLVDDIASIYDVNEKYFNDRSLINYNGRQSFIDSILVKFTNRILNLNRTSLQY